MLKTQEAAMKICLVLLTLVVMCLFSGCMTPDPELPDASDADYFAFNYGGM